MRSHCWTAVVIEDSERYARVLKLQLEGFGFRKVVVASDGDEGLKAVEAERPWLVLVDITVPRITGTEVCRRLERTPYRHEMAIVILTVGTDRPAGLDSGADAFLVKQQTGAAELRAEVVARLRRIHRPLFPVNRLHQRFTISFLADQRLRTEVEGITNLVKRIDGTLSLRPEEHAWYAEKATSSDFRREIKFIGSEVLFQRIFIDHPEVLAGYRQAAAGADPLHLRFEAPREYLALPLEFLYDRHSAFGGEYIVLQHPFARVLDDVAGRASISRQFFNARAADQGEINVLLIASNTTSGSLPAIPGVDVEVSKIETILTQLRGEYCFPVSVTTLRTESADKETVKKALRGELGRQFDIVHYAGHGYFNRERPEKSALYFWNEPGRGGGVTAMEVPELQHVLAGSSVRFVFFSACSSSASATEAHLWQDDFLGIAEGAIRSGVSAVLGFRQPVADASAVSFAETFYAQLAETGELDVALWLARRQIAANNREDLTWLTPMLIQQRSPHPIIE